MAHAEGAFSEEVCAQEDIDWIKNFYERILDRSDPIAIIYQNSKVKNEKSAPLCVDDQMENHIDDQGDSEMKAVDLLIAFFVIIVILFVVILVAAIIVF